MTKRRLVGAALLVTSSYHTRRVRSLWHQLVGDSPQAIVQFTDEEPFNAGRWWARLRGCVDGVARVVRTAQRVARLSGRLRTLVTEKGLY